MSYKVIVDSCGELTPEMKASGIFETASLTIEVGGHHIVDDETFDQKQFLQYVAEAAECPKSSCPSPEKYMEKYDCDVDRVYAVTLSAELSGSYNSAVLGMNLYHEEHGEKNIHVFNSCSASIGETLIALKIRECEEQGMTYEQVIETVEAYIESQHTYFVLETLDTLRKNGRLTGIKALVATALNIKPVMGAACKNGSAMLFVSSKVSQLALLPQGRPEAARRAKAMIAKMDELGFGNCTNTRACEAVCPKCESIANIARLNREFIKAKLND